MDKPENYKLFLSLREREVMLYIGKYGENLHTDFQLSRLHISDTTVRSHMTRIFQRFMEAEKFMAEYYDVFHGRFNKHTDNIAQARRDQSNRRRSATR